MTNKFRELTPSGHELVLKLKRLKPPYSKPSYKEIADRAGLSVATVHGMLRGGKYALSNWFNVEAVLTVLKEPLGEYRELWEKAQEEQLALDIIVSDPLNPVDTGKTAQHRKIVALTAAATIYQGVGLSAKQVIETAIEFEEWLSGQYLSD